MNQALVSAGLAAEKGGEAEGRCGPNPVSIPTEQEELKLQGYN